MSSFPSGLRVHPEGYQVPMAPDIRGNGFEVWGLRRDQNALRGPAQKLVLDHIRCGALPNFGVRFRAKREQLDRTFT